MTDESDPRLTRSPLELTLVDRHGEEVTFTARPFSDENFIELNQWIRREYMNRIEDSVSELQSPSLRDKVISGAIATVPTIDYMDRSLGSAMFTSIDGLAKAMQISLRDDMPEVSLQEIRTLMLIKVNRKAAAQFWTETNLDQVSGETKDPPGES